jgi:hypothetical protein
MDMPQQLDYESHLPPAKAPTPWFGAISMVFVGAFLVCLFYTALGVRNDWIVRCFFATPVLGFVLGTVGIFRDRPSTTALSAVGLHLTILLALLGLLFLARAY